MADSSKQSFLNSLFQWTVKNTAEEEAAAATTTTDVEPMTAEVTTFIHCEKHVFTRYF